MASSATPGRFITAQALAEHLDVTVQVVYRLSASGRIPSYKLGHRTLRFRLDEVLDALRSEPPPPEPPPAPRRCRPPRVRPAPLPAYNWPEPS